MSKYEETYRIYFQKWRDRISAIYQTFEPLIINRGLIRDTEFILPPNEFSILGGSASPDASECGVVVCIDVPPGSRVTLEVIQGYIDGVDRFLGDVQAPRTKIDRDDRIKILRDQFRKASRNTADIRRVTDVIFITPGKVSKGLRSRARDFDGLRTEFIDIDDFEKRSQGVSSEVDFSDLGDLPRVHLASSVEGDHDIYMGVISGESIARLFDSMGNTLLESNVRMFLGERGPNKGIALTIEEAPHRFAAYNNGITMVAREAKIADGKVTSASGVSVVNGGQTTVSVYRAFRREVDISQVQVPLKFVIIKSEDHSSREALLQSISKYSNTQNKVNSADRLAMDPPHPKLQEISKLQKYDVNGVGWFYARRRGELTTLEISDPAKYAVFRTRYPPENVMESTQLAKLWDSWWGSPEVGASGKTKAFEWYHDQLLLKTHLKNWSVESHHIGSIALWMMYKHLFLYVGKNYSGLRNASIPHVLGLFSHFTENKVDLRAIKAKGRLPEPVITCLESLVEPVDREIRSYEEGDQKEWTKKHECTEHMRALSMPLDFATAVKSIKMMRRGESLREEDYQPFLQKIGKDKLWDAFRFAKDRRGDSLNGSYFNNSMKKYPKLSPGGASQVIRVWNAACSDGYEEQFPGDEDFFAPHLVKRRRR